MRRMLQAANALRLAGAAIDDAARCFTMQPALGTTQNCWPRSAMRITACRFSSALWSTAAMG